MIETSMLRILLLLSQAGLIPFLGPYHFNIYIYVDTEHQNILLHASTDSILQYIFVACISFLDSCTARSPGMYRTCDLALTAGLAEA